jgi:superfamily II DNA or RNA helicase
MPDSVAEKLLRETVLDDIERNEARRLVWGLVDGLLSDQELQELVTTPLTRALRSSPDLRYISESEVISDLVADGFLHRTPDGLGYRSRMAEAIRLFSKLRQLFPKHEHGSTWLSAPTLVADYRFLWRRRRYPKRDVSLEQALAAFEQRLSNSDGVLHILQQRLAGMMPQYRLSGFQIEATARILQGLQSHVPQATLVSAGTGSGKTLAFYLPALTWVSANMSTGTVARVQVLAIYPRTELLKDQFTEVFRQARTFDGLAHRPIRIAALYGGVPPSAAAVAYEQGGSTMWEQVATGFKCPYLRCPSPGCSGFLVWRTEDQAKANERLYCSACDCIVTDQQVVLTRQRMQREPPDVLFSTAEMLNRGLSDSRSFHLFGVGPNATRAPDLVLLDEVHLYGSTFGAQIGYLIRRWRARARTPAHFVGLSATLRNGAQFFARLTGMQEERVVEIEPMDRDMVPEGAEYLLALRGDPVSRRSLLSTTIQTMMLAARILDPRLKAPQRGVFGWRTFLFTDQMDSVNRLLAKGRDAEGCFERTGEPNFQKYPDGGLARLREPHGMARYNGGQDWSFIQDYIGHPLTGRLRISRTTSSDRGVDSGSEVVLATAALEVGFDDPQVGAVIQHKAPRDIASFLQRKGRAGRTRGTRPWTIVVLSDYGRDRISYQAYDQLFDPELPPRNLPLKNRYVQRIQSVYALLEYLSDQLPTGTPAEAVWNDLLGPVALQSEGNLRILNALWNERVTSTPLSPAVRADLHQEARRRVNDLRAIRWLYARERRALLVGILAAIESDPVKLAECSRAIQKSLLISDQELQSIVWEYPRPLALAVVPTAVRRLVTNWRAEGGDGEDFTGSGPLPDFAPGQLFSDLSLPEVELQIPAGPGAQGSAVSRGNLPVLQALNEFAPGKVSWRYDTALWIAPAQIDPAAHEIELAVDDFYLCDASDPFPVRDIGGIADLPAYRPRSAILSRVPFGVFQDTSNARLHWLTQIVAFAPALEFSVPAQSPLASIIRRIRFHSHGTNSPAQIRRYAPRSDASLRRPRSSESQDVRFQFRKAGAPCVLGFEIEADAIAVELTLPTSISATLNPHPEALRALRTARYSDDIRNGPVLASVEANPFVREWLGNIFLTAASFHALSTGGSLQDSCGAVVSGKAALRASDILGAIFQSPLDEDDDGGAPDREDRLRQGLEQSLQSTQVMNALFVVAARLWEPVDVSWDPWLAEVARATIGGAMLAACGSLCPDIDVEALLVDTDAGPRAISDPYANIPRDQELWITETAPGGNGLLEAVIGQYVENPIRLFELIEGALGPSEYEFTDRQLTRLVRDIGATEIDSELRAAVLEVRRASSTDALIHQFSTLRRLLASRGYSVFHGFAAALSSRLLRPGSPPGIDHFLSGALIRWGDAEQKLGVEIDNRLVAFLVSEDDSIDQLLIGAGLDPPTNNRRAWRFNAIYSLLWPRGPVIREATVRVYNPFGTIRAAPERLLLEALIAPVEPPIDARLEGWELALTEALTQRSTATLELDPTDLLKITAVLRHAILEPISLEYMNIYPVLNRVLREGGRLLMRFELSHPL